MIGESNKERTFRTFCFGSYNISYFEIPQERFKYVFNSSLNFKLPFLLIAALLTSQISSLIVFLSIDVSKSMKRGVDDGTILLWLPQKITVMYFRDRV